MESFASMVLQRLHQLQRLNKLPFAPKVQPIRPPLEARKVTLRIKQRVKIKQKATCLRWKDAWS